MLLYCVLYCVELLIKLEEESQLMSHDLEDTTVNPSEATIELTKSLIDCIEKYINGTYINIINTTVSILIHTAYRMPSSSNVICST